MFSGRQSTRVPYDTAVWDEYLPKIGPTALVLYETLRQHTLKSPECSPGMRRITALTGIDRRAICRELPTLEGCGLISIRREHRAGHNARNHYTVRHPLCAPAGQPVLLPASVTFEISDELEAWAKEHELSWPVIERETEKFMIFARRRRIAPEEMEPEWRLWMLRSLDHDLQRK